MTSESTGLELPEEKTRSALPTVLAVVVTHRGKPWLRRCLLSLAAQEYSQLDILVVDDASPDSREDPTTKRIAKRHLRRRRWGYLRTPRPLGYGGAINFALSRVRTRADLLLFLHDDVELQPDVLDHLIVRMREDPETAIVGPKIVGWDDPMRLEEVGMAADRFGYPYRGLEEGEIDLGQRDSASEVFYVTSTCMLVKHEVFKDLRGWDARLRAFAEDLDLCWRARLAGHNVRVAPAAKVAHAMALAKGERESPFDSVRYLTRRNRLRTVFKNASGFRLLVLVPQFVLLTFAEMLGFILLRQPHEIGNLARALAWNFFRLPQTLAVRFGIQRRRKVSDFKLRRLTIRQGTRVRAYVVHQRGRIEQAWGRRADLVAARTEQARSWGGNFKGWLGIATVLAALALILGFRHVWWGPEAAVGDLLPYPERPLDMWRSFISPWRDVGLGEPGAGPPALALLGIFPLLALGAAGAAQKLLVLALGLLAFSGAYRMVADLVDRRGRFAAGATYMLGAVGYAGLRQGALGALVFGAVAPYVLRSLIRLAGWARPSGWSGGRAVARTALGAAISAAFVPGSLFIYAVVLLLLVLMRSVFVPSRAALSGLGGGLLGLLFGWTLLLPWSAGWWGDAGVLQQLAGDETWQGYAAGFAGHDVLTVVLGQTPSVPPLLGLALPLFGLVAVVAGVGQRRRLALALWAVVLAVGWFVGAVASGVIRPVVASPVEAGVVASAAFAGLVGLAAGAFRLDLPRRGFGRVHWAALGAMATAVFLLLTGLGPALFHGEWRPGAAAGETRPEVVAQVRSLLEAEARADPARTFRALWVGETWNGPTRTSARPRSRSFVTGPRGQMLTELFERRLGLAASELRKVVSSIDQGATDRGGGLLGAFNIRYVVLERGDSADWLTQRDLALVRSEGDYYLFENRELLPRAGVYDRLPAYVEAVEDVTASPSIRQREGRLAVLSRFDLTRYAVERTTGSGVAFLAERGHPSWEAEAGGVPLARVPGGWGNAFLLPEGSEDLVIESRRSPTDMLWLVALALAWIVVVGASFSKARERKKTRSGR
jgi:GT2 family glycosyltransferase